MTYFNLWLHESLMMSLFVFMFTVWVCNRTELKDNNGLFFHIYITGAFLQDHIHDVAESDVHIKRGQSFKKQGENKLILITS